MSKNSEKFLSKAHRKLWWPKGNADRKICSSRFEKMIDTRQLVKFYFIITIYQFDFKLWSKVYWESRAKFIRKLGFVFEMINWFRFF